MNYKNLLCHRRKCEGKGSTLINNAFDNTSNLMGYDTFKTTFDLNVNFVDYYSLIQSIPRSNRIILSTIKKKLKRGEIIQVYAKLLIKKRFADNPIGFVLTQ